MARVTLEFDIPEDEFRAVLGGDAPGESAEGITVEGVAAHLVRRHDPIHGYIHWRINTSR